MTPKKPGLSDAVAPPSSNTPKQMNNGAVNKQFGTMIPNMTAPEGKVVDPETGRVMGLGDFYTGSFGSQTEPEIGLANRLRRTGILVDW